MKRIKASNYSITLSSAVVFTKPKAIASCKSCGSTELGESITNKIIAIGAYRNSGNCIENYSGHVRVHSIKSPST